MTSFDQKLTIFSEKVHFLHIITWFKCGLLSTKQTEIIEKFLFLDFYGIYRDHVVSEYGQNVLKGYKLKVIKLVGGIA